MIESKQFLVMALKQLGKGDTIPCLKFWRLGNVERALFSDRRLPNPAIVSKPCSSCNGVRLGWP